MEQQFRVRPATSADEPAIEALIEASVYGLLAVHHPPAVLRAAIGDVFGLDRQLIEDGTYFAVDVGARLVGCGGWSKRNRRFGGDGRGGAGAGAVLDPQRDAARIRAFFVHPDFARRGIGSAIMEACEQAIAAAGFDRVHISATRAGELLYRRFGYRTLGRAPLLIADGHEIEVIDMAKSLP